MATALPSSSPAIEANGLTKRYGRVLAVNQLSLTVNQGEVFGFLGPNGSGKSTTMRMLLGLARPSSGTATILGHDVNSDLAKILSHTGALIETPTFYPFLSGRENLRVVADLTGSPNSRVEDVLATVDLTADAGRKFTTYSMGMKQRIGIASALLTDPDLLILDEPANGLDPAGIVEIRNLMQRLRSEGKTIFVSSHVLHEVEQVCDRVAILNRGHVVAQGRVQDLLGGKEQIEIQVDPAARAAEILRAVDWVSDVAVEENSLIVSAPVTRSAELTQVLAVEGLYVSVIRPRQESLERYFLELTGEAA